MDYYAWLGEDVAGMIGDSAAKDAETVAASTSPPTRKLGCDELVFCPSSGDPRAGRPARRRRRPLSPQSSRPTWRRIETESE